MKAFRFTSPVYAAILSVLPVTAATLATAGETPSAPDAVVYFQNLEDGATVSGPVVVRFGLSGMGVAPAGTDKENTGHHHVLLNRPAFGELEEDADTLEYGIPADDTHLHFGGGQTETVLMLDPGEHTLQLLLGDIAHIPHDPPVMSERITIVVE